MQVIEINAQPQSKKRTQHQVEFKRDGYPSKRVGFSVRGDFTIKQAKDVMMAAAKTYRDSLDFEKMVVLF